MAWVESDSSGGWHLRFRFQGRKYKRTLQTHDEKEANDLAGQARNMLRSIKLGVVQLPENVDLATFVLSAGKQAQVVAPAVVHTLGKLLDDYFNALPEGSLEESTVEGMKVHQRQLLRLLGAKTRLTDITQSKLQDYINTRAKQPVRAGEKRKVAATTVKKGIVTLRAIWNWGITRGIVHQPFPGKGLKYPKGKQKPPFQTRAEIERQFKGLTDAERNEVEGELWDSLYLTSDEMQELLAFASKTTEPPFLYPMIATAAHTGARRAELMRLTVSDLDLKSGHISIHERKKSHERRTQRRVPLSPLLSRLLGTWMKSHQGGRALFYQTTSSRKKKRTTPESLTRDEVHHHFKSVFEGSKWQVVRGWHVLRHSFISALASKGIDQRVIDDFVGHSTEEQRRRYRHLYPDVAHRAIASVFS